MPYEPLDESGMPTWVKVFVALAVALGLFVIGVLVFGGGEHGPGRHAFGDVDASGTSGGTVVGEACESRPVSHATEPVRDDGFPGGLSAEAFCAPG